MTASSVSTRRVLRDIEVRDLLPSATLARHSFTDADLDDAYQRGAAEARAQMATEREDAVRSLATTVRDASTTLGEALAALRAHYCGRVVDDAFVLAAWLVCREVTAEPSLMRARVEEALSGIDDDTIVLAVTPGLADAVSAWVPSATVRPDPTLRAGELRIDTSSTTVDGTFVDALRRLHAAFDAGSIAEVTQ